MRKLFSICLSIVLIVACGTNSATPSTDNVTTSPIQTTPTSTSTTTTTTTTTTTVPRFGKCAQWHNLAIEQGWPEEELEQLDIVMWRESRCQPDAWNGWDAGLMQINQIHSAWITEFGWKHPDDMFDPAKNLHFAYRLWLESGWKPWKKTSGLPQ